MTAQPTKPHLPRSAMEPNATYGWWKGFSR